MKNNLDFTPIDITTWERGGHFWYFSQMAPTGYSITVDIDVTNLKNTLKSNNISFYPAYLWLVTKALNEHKEFKISQKDGKIGYFASLCPLYAIFHRDNKTFSLMWTEYSDDFREFYKAYSVNKEKYSQNKGILAQTDKTPPENAYTVSCLPWIDFKHFAASFFATCKLDFAQFVICYAFHTGNNHQRASYFLNGTIFLNHTSSAPFLISSATSFLISASISL